ncbi:MAG: tRNA (adenosine(37)-N6)-threonylcarbamoyltransferase complex dimerization subunit type 1 TsaB [Bacteroidota bacterium]
MPTILCIETSAALCSVVVVNNHQIYYAEERKHFAHAEVLTSLITTCISNAGITMKELNAVAISGGPGSYTGLRIGSSTAKGLCYALDIPLIALDTLQITTAAAQQKFPDTQQFWAMTDARRMEVYHAVYDKDLQPLTTTVSGIITDANFRPDVINIDTLLCGDGAAKAVEHLQLKDAEVVANASAMCALAEQAYDAKHFADKAYYEPFYLKQANITVSKS